MKRASGGSFILALLFNMAWRFEWVILFIILLVLHFTLSIPLWIAFIPLGCWLIHGILVTLLFTAASRAGSEPTPYRENKNPYSEGNTKPNINSNSGDSANPNVISSNSGRANPNVNPYSKGHASPNKNQ